MGDMQVGIANIEDKGFYGLMEDKPVNASVSPTLQVSVSFGRFENDSLSWEKFSAFSPNKYLEEVGKCATPGSVAQKKAYFEAHYKKIAERKAEIMDQEKQLEKNESFRSVVTDQEIEVDEEDKHVIDIATEVSIDEVNEERIVVKECQELVDEVKEEVKESLDTPKVEKQEEIVLVEEKPEENVLVEEKSEVIVRIEEKPEEVLQIIEENPSKDEPIIKEEVKKEKKHNTIKKNDGNVRTNLTKPHRVTTTPITNKIVTSKKTPPSKEIKSVMKVPKKPVSKGPLSAPRMYKPAPQTTSLSTSYSSMKKENVSSLMRNKQTGGPKSLHTSLNTAPPASSDPTANTTRKSLIMDRMGDKDIVKRAFKTFKKSMDLKTSVNEPNTALKKNPAETATSNKPGMEKRSSTTTTYQPLSRGLKSNFTAEKQQKELSRSAIRHVEKTRVVQKNPTKAGRVTDAKPRKDSLNLKAKPMQGSVPKRTLPK